jgi:hypothetical protein
MLKSDFVLVLFSFAIPFSQNKIPPKKSFRNDKVATNLMKMGKFEKSLIKSRIALKLQSQSKTTTA